MKKELSETQRKSTIDLNIIVIVTLIVLGLFIVFQRQFYDVVLDNSIHILLRTTIAALIQFGVAGLGITIVSLFRKESFLSHGLKFKGALQSILFCIICFVPYIIFSVLIGNATSYSLFKNVVVTKEILTSGFPINAIGMTIITIAWGFFEGFNYVFISDKINARYKSNYKWLNWGAISCAILCILIHGAIGITVEGIIEMFTIMIIVYGMLMVKEFTSNAWGCVFIFVLLWNAF